MFPKLISLLGMEKQTLTPQKAHIHQSKQMYYNTT